MERRLGRKGTNAALKETAVFASPEAMRRENPDLNWAPKSVERKGAVLPVPRANPDTK